MVYHGCFKRNTDGTNRLITKEDVCSKPTNILFWMSTQDVVNSVKTLSQKRNQKDVKKVDFDEYFIKKTLTNSYKNHLKKRLK